MKHFALLREGPNESALIWQIQMQLLVCEREWCDFVSYNPNFKRSLFVRRIHPDTKAQEKIKNGLALGREMLQELLESKAVKYESESH